MTFICVRGCVHIVYTPDWARGARLISSHTQWKGVKKTAKRYLDLHAVQKGPYIKYDCDSLVRSDCK